MKKVYLFFAACAALVLSSCKEESMAPIPGEGNLCYVQVSVQGDSSPSSQVGTRATETTYSDEGKVNSLQVFVFNGDDREAYKSVMSSLSALVPATSGERVVWAIANAPDLSSVMTLSGLKEAVSELSDNSRDNFIMTGSVAQELVDGGKVNITVKRIVSRVSISRISTSLKDYRSDYSVRIEKLYLINVAGDNRYEVGGEPGKWVNKLGHLDDAYDGLLFDMVSSGSASVIVKNNVYQKNGEPVGEEEAYNETTHRLADGVTVVTDNSYSKEHAFYPYPNAFPVEGETPSYADEWNPRGTILVIEATMLDKDGEPIKLNEAGQTTGYYPIILPALERNKTYTIDEVRITRLPGDKPYKPIETGETQVTISVNEWELGVNLGTITI